MKLAELAAYVTARLAVIQTRHNFNPQLRARQVAHVPDVAAAYGQFRELLRLNDNFGLAVKVPYEPSGLRPMKRREARTVVPVCVYFARKEGTTYWKIGSSISPSNRVKSVETGNDGSLRLLYAVPYMAPKDGRVMERRLKRYFQALKTRDRNSTVKGEWFDLDPLVVRDTVKQLKSGETFVGIKPVKKGSHGRQERT